VQFEPVATKDGDLEFVDGIKGGSVPREYIPKVENGLRDGFKAAASTATPSSTSRATLHDGKYHEVDSSEMAFHAAGVLAFRQAVREQRHAARADHEGRGARARGVPGGVVGDLNSAAARSSEVDSIGNQRVVRAQVPIAEMFAYSSSLRGATQGRGTYAMELWEYRDVPNSIAEKVLKGGKES
jgi:elongation factor G